MDSSSDRSKSLRNSGRVRQCLEKVSAGDPERVDLAPVRGADHLRSRQTRKLRYGESPGLLVARSLFIIEAGNTAHLGAALYARMPAYRHDAHFSRPTQPRDSATFSNAL